MTIEEKARAYDEALEDMRVIYPNLKGDAKLAVEHAFPQLRESEDERIRKWLVNYFGSIKETVWIHMDITCEQILGWLEKQKEQKPMDKHLAVYLASVIARDIDRVMDGMCISNTECVALENAFLNGEYDKISDFLEKKYTANKQDQKPAEWSDYKDKIDIPYCSSELAWSKEDEKIFNNIIEKAKGGHWIEVNEITWLINRFKSLRPSWKPSEEQMKALESCFCEFGEGCPDEDGLRSLYNDLKRL